MAYEALQLNQELHISAVYTVHYFEYRSDFHFPGEVHDFWEFQCIDKGSAKSMYRRSYLPFKPWSGHLP